MFAQQVIDKCIDFATLGYSQLETLVTDDELNVRTERTVFEAIIRWIGGDIEHRKDKLHSLLSLLRFGRIELSFIENEMTNNCLIKDDIRCKELVKQFRKEYKLLSKSKTIFISRNKFLIISFSQRKRRKRFVCGTESECG